MTLLLYVLASFGLAFVIGYSKITLPTRTFIARRAVCSDCISHGPWNDCGNCLSKPQKRGARWLLSLLECPACLAFWFGVAATFTPIADFIPFSTSPLPLALFLGFANCGAVLTIGMITGLIRTE